MAGTMSNIGIYIAITTTPTTIPIIIIDIGSMRAEKLSTACV